MTSYLVWGTSRSASLADSIPISALSDPIGYLEIDGKGHILARGGDETRVSELGLELVSLNELGWRELQDAHVPFDSAMAELVLRACRSLEVGDVLVPDEFPLTIAAYLRANGVDAQVDAAEFMRRRRVKTAAQLEGVRRAQGAAEAAVDHVRRRFLEGGPDLTVDGLRQEMVEVYAQHGSEPHWDFLVVAVGAHGSDGMDPGSPGPIPEGIPVVIDASPRDYRTGMWGDICRGYSIGGPTPELLKWHPVVLEALEASKAAVAPGVPADAPYYAALDVLEDAGVSTLRTMAAGTPAREYIFNHAVGHGMGFELHDAPHVSEWGATETLIVGDVIALEPAVYQPGEFGLRIEDVVVVTEEGYERIGSYDFDL